MPTPYVRPNAPGTSLDLKRSARVSRIVSCPEHSLNKPTAVVTLLMCCIGMFGHVIEAADNWSPTGSMSTGRARHTATLLSDLRHVLVTGGSVAGGISATAEIYDSWTGTWSSAASMITARVDHAATLLPNGGVLVTGGRDNATAQASAEVYDVLTNIWSPAASMSTSRVDHTATPLPDGRVLVIGGAGPTTPSALASAEIYDSPTNTWTSAGSMSVGRIRHTATLLLDGRVLVAGGENSGEPEFYLASADIYDPAMNKWSPTDLMDFGRQSHTATRLASGQVLVAGGFGAGGPFDSTELYDPIGTGSWSPTALMSTKRADHTASLLVDARVLVAGSFATPSGPPGLASAETYDFDSTTGTGTWSATASMSNSRYGHTSTRLLDGRVLVAGGFADGNTRLASAELFSYDATAQLVGIDIKPNALPNTVNLGSNGTVAVAILSTPSFDAAAIDPSSVTLASAPVRFRGQGTPLASLEDVNGDGLDDLVLHVNTQSFQLSAADTAAILEGMTFDGTTIVGSDTVRIVP